MAPCPSKLPSVCLERIFKYVPLAELLRTIGLVCSTWYNSRRTELMRRRRLVIVEDAEQFETIHYHNLHIELNHYMIQFVRRLDGSLWLAPESRNLYEFDSLVLPSNKLELLGTSSLMSLSNITKLSLMLKNVSSFTISQVILIIEHMSANLIDLKLGLNFIRPFAVKYKDKAQVETNLTNLFDKFIHLPSLNHLGLDFYEFEQDLPQLALLPRLSTFSLRMDPFCYKHGDWIMSTIRRLAPNIDSIRIDNIISLQDLLGVDHQQSTKFTVLNIYNITINELDDLKLFCTRFSSLKKLSIDDMPSNVPMTLLARCLSQLTQLIHLHLLMDKVPNLEEPQLDEQGHQLEPVIAQVPSVLSLILDFDTSSHLDTERLFISEIFPNLQVLALKHLYPKCSVCPTSLECERLARQPFRLCANLHTVALIDCNDYGNVIPLSEL